MKVKFRSPKQFLHLIITKSNLFRASVFIIALGMILYVWPLPSSLLGSDVTVPLRVIDRNGQLLYEFRRGAPGSQEWIPYAHIPERVIDTLIATEDRTFYQHGGVSLRGTLRALVQNVTSGRVISGGSTITQQLVRVRIGASSRALWRKALEAFYALKLERALTKEQIIESYLNSAYFGHQAYGIKAAAKTYFGKTPSELSTGEISLLIGLLQSPSAYDPFQNRSAAQKRRSLVLTSMEEQGIITPEENDEAMNAPIHLAPDTIDIEAPHYVFWMLDQCHAEPCNASDEMKTTLDLNLQRSAQRIVDHHLARLSDLNVTSAAVVVLDAKTGDILTMIGSANYFDKEHDGAVNVAVSPRQPGSAIKPFTYALAFAQGMTAATTVADVETQYFTEQGNPYLPRNYDYDEHGLVRLRDALGNSYNIAAVKVLEKVGVGKLMQFLRSAGITTLTQPPEHYGLALTLGDAEVTLLELTRAFGTFARGGITFEGNRVLPADVAWLVSDILSDPNARLQQFGEGGPLSFDFPVAVKTGTTRNSRDNWTVGFTPNIVVGVWVGNADNSPMKGTSGVTGAAPIFHDVMLAAEGQRDVMLSGAKHFQKPSSIIEKEICALSGKLPTPECTRVIRESFIAGTEPKEFDDMHKKFLIDARTGLLASDSCPKQFVKEEVFVIFPPEVQRWARQKGFKQPPRDISPLCHPERSEGSVMPSGDEASWLLITRPHDGDTFQLDPLVPDKNEKIIFEASASPDIKEIEWNVVMLSPVEARQRDNKRTIIGTGKAPSFRVEWEPKEGSWEIAAKSGEIKKVLKIGVGARNGL